MARKGRAPKVKERRRPEEVVLAEEGPREFRLQSGRVIEYKPMNPDLRQAIFDSYPDPEPPMLEMKTIDGGVEVTPDTENPEYRDELRGINRLRAEALMRLLVVQCLEDLEPDEGWIEKQKWIVPDWEPPGDPLELKKYWVEHWLLGPQDAWPLLQAAQLAAMLSPEEVEQQLKSFRPQMARALSQQVVGALGPDLAQLGAGDDLGRQVGGDTVA